MINEENLKKMYDGLIEQKELTTKELSEYGFHSKDLTKLIENGTLQRVKRGHYLFVAIEDLFLYGKKLIALSEYKKATVCFETCYQLDPNHLGTCFQLFLRSIQNRDYQKSFEYFDHLYDSDNEFYHIDNNYYLYLLSTITEIPERYREYAKFLKFKDIRVDFHDKRYENINLQNKIRLLSFDQKFLIAGKQLNEYIEKKGKIDVQDIIIKILLNQAFEKQNRVKKEIIQLANNKQYDQIIQYLQSIEKYCSLSSADECILSLAMDISELMKTGIIPKKKISSSHRLFDAIRGKNFELALTLSLNFIENQNIKPEDNTIFILLTHITNLIKEKTSKQVPVRKKVEEVSTEENKTLLGNSPSINRTNLKNIFVDTVQYLMKQEFAHAFDSLKNYLESIDKLEYEFLIMDLIKISVIQQDMAFTKPITVLTHISRGEFVFDLSEYIQNFYVTLSKNQFDETRLYLDIISKSDCLGQECILTNELEKVLSSTEKIYNASKNKEFLNSINSSLDPKNMDLEQNSSTTPTQHMIIPTVNEQVEKTREENEPNIEKESNQGAKMSEIVNTSEIKLDKSEEHKLVEKEIIEKPLSEPILSIKEKSNSKKSQPMNQNFNARELVNSKLNKVHERGIVLLKPMEDAQIQEIYKVVEEMADIVSFSIGTDQKQVVLKSGKLETMEFKELSREGNEAYCNRDYKLCIAKYRQILEYKEPKAWIYSKLGLAYMKNHNKDLAIDYLTVATELAKQEGLNYDFVELIAYLKGWLDIPIEDRKVIFKMTEDEFEYDTNQSYGLENIEELSKLISSGISLEEACIKLDFSDQQKAIAYLITAKECYIQENFLLGDSYFKKAEKMKNKSKSIIKLLEEIKVNKKFYKNRKKEDYKPLILKYEKN